MLMSAPADIHEGSQTGLMSVKPQGASCASRRSVSLIIPQILIRRIYSELQENVLSPQRKHLILVFI